MILNDFHQEEVETKQHFSCAKSFKTAFRLFVKLFERREVTQKDNMLRYILRSKAWIVHCTYTVAIILLWVTGRSIWLGNDRSCFDQVENAANLQEEEFTTGMTVNDDDCVPMRFRKDLVDTLRPAVRLLSVCGIFFSSIVAILCYKWRRIADIIVYIHLVQFLVNSIIPAS